jgi:hypothetical protein
MIPDQRLQDLITAKDHGEALKWCAEHGYDEFWSIIDGTLIVFDGSAPPAWLRPVLDARDEDGNTALA